MKKKIRTNAIENGLFSQAVLIRRTVMEEEGQKSSKNNQNTILEESQQGHKIGLLFILSG